MSFPFALATAEFPSSLLHHFLGHDMSFEHDVNPFLDEFMQLSDDSPEPPSRPATPCLVGNEASERADGALCSCGACGLSIVDRTTDWRHRKDHSSRHSTVASQDVRSRLGSGHVLPKRSLSHSSCDDSTRGDPRRRIEDPIVANAAGK